ncbi:MAG: cache domain-containing protein [Lachnospiraceae bacterium]|nr:cache domain-containing protein [Lachnospiraceae bacterium]
MRKSNFTLLKMLLMFGLIPLIATVVCFFILTYFNVSKLVQKNVRTEISLCNKEFNNYVSGAYGDTLGTEEWSRWKSNDLVDGFVDEGIYMAIYYGDTALISSVKNENGSRMEGEKASQEVIASVLRGGKHYYDTKEEIGGKEYYVDYRPIRNGTGKTVGMTFIGKDVSVVKKDITRIILRVMICGLALISVFSVVIILVARTVKKPFADMANALEICAEGRVSEKFSVHSIVRENQNMIQSLGQFQESLNGTVNEVKNATQIIGDNVHSVNTLSEDTQTAANHISSAVEELAQGAQSMAESVQDVNLKVSDMGEYVADIEGNVERLSSSADEMNTINTNASQSMGQVLTSFKDTIDAVNSITDQILRTNDSIEKVNEAVELIISIASQTKLLSLNASIEAARAGESGKGFAVVAKSIGELSLKSNEGATSIQQIAKEVLANSEESVKLARNIRNVIEESQADIEKTSKEFGALNEAIEANVQAIQEVRENTRKLAEIKEAIVSNVSDLSAISEENAASSEEVSASIESVSENVNEISREMSQVEELSDHLAETVSFFS